RGPRCLPGLDVPAGDGPADDAGHRGRDHPRLRSEPRAVHRVGPPRRGAHDPRRQPHPEPVRGGAQQPLRVGRGVRADGGRPRAALRLLGLHTPEGTGRAAVRGRGPFLRAHTWLIYLFLYAPIAILVVFSFNKATQTAVWQGFTAEWY